MNNALLPTTDLGKSEAFASHSKKSATGDQSFSDSFEDVKREIDADAKDKNIKKPAVNTVGNDKSATTEASVSDKDLANEKIRPETSSDDSISTDQALIEESRPDQAPSSEVLKVGSSEVLNQLPKVTVSPNQIDTVSDLNSMTSDASNDDLLASLKSLVDITSNNTPDSIFTPKELSALQQYLQQVEGGNTLPISPELVSVLDKLKQFVSGNQTDFLASTKTSPRLETLHNALSLLINEKISLSDSTAAVVNNDVKIKQSSDQLASSTSANTAVTTTLVSQDSVVGKDVLENNLIAQILEGEVIDKPLENRVNTVATISENSLTSATPSPVNSPIAKAQLSINVPFQQGQWGEQVSNKVMWMSSKGLQEAEIHLDPPELGPLQVRVSVVNEQAHVSFVVQHSSVREALDQNAMRLRDMFEGEGIDLVDVDVSDQSENPESESDGTEADSQPLLSDETDSLISGTVIKQTIEGYSLINTYV